MSWGGDGVSQPDSPPPPNSRDAGFHVGMIFLFSMGGELGRWRRGHR